MAAAFSLSSPAWCIGDPTFDTAALERVAMTLLAGLALLCSPLFLFVTWASARLVRIEGVRLGRAYLVVLAEIVLGLVAMACMPGFGREEGVRETIQSSVAIAIAAIAAMAFTKFLLGTTWKKAVATCLLSWAMIVVPLVLVFIREVVQWLSWQLFAVR